jgi:hypothetical protein
MPGAIRLYESLGFVRDPSIDFTPVPGIDLLAYVMDWRRFSDRAGASSPSTGK